MDRKSKFLLFVVGVFIFLSIASAYYKIIVTKDYLLLVEVPCDPIEESCYFYEEEDSGELLTYKIIQRHATTYPNCDPADEACLDSALCSPEESDCVEIQCDTNTESDLCWKI